ncbi:uncharacterized protein BO80DRAFT_460293 [Aspergillus ibericus CBS 121593]|uniref:Uncharacterized protein n=1 Tax=Aspergillus ibericus CBS 121593 TaxID=1448316 RepID=A0A395GHH4_9EURO|nr:hypothetical protein BO80DRAFT_460293 [Aspergillus ibericus CBS 121593]RAK94790.1 hypothetical protein BO80DRAFT_460293 [Aspergillus ibericus CBS 121593]
MYCAFIDCMREVDATWPVCEGPGTGVPGSLRSTVPGRECTSFPATLICKRVALYNSPARLLAVGRENNCCVFQGQWNFETDCILHNSLRDG